MEGPTPVSALIHAATMVTAGVFMVARTGALFELAPASAAVVAIVGIGTALYAATIAVAQHDINGCWPTQPSVSWATCSPQWGPGPTRPACST